MLIYELFNYAVELRNDWSDFDGRDNLKFLDLWLAKLSKELDIEYHSYYEAYWPKAYTTQYNRFKEANLLTEEVNGQ